MGSTTPNFMRVTGTNDTLPIEVEADSAVDLSEQIGGGARVAPIQVLEIPRMRSGWATEAFGDLLVDEFDLFLGQAELSFTPELLLPVVHGGRLFGTVSRQGRGVWLALVP